MLQVRTRPTSRCGPPALFEDLKMLDDRRERDCQRLGSWLAETGPRLSCSSMALRVGSPSAWKDPVDTPLVKHRLEYKPGSRMSSRDLTIGPRCPGSLRGSPPRGESSVHQRQGLFFEDCITEYPLASITVLMNDDTRRSFLLSAAGAGLLLAGCPKTGGEAKSPANRPATKRSRRLKI